MLYKASSLTGFRLNCLDGEIGKVKEFFFDDRYWTIRYLVAETGNWLTGRQVLISPYALSAVNRDEENIAVDLTRQRIEESPPLESDKPVSRQYEEDFHGYYGLSMYWKGPFRWGFEPYLLSSDENWRKPNPNDYPWDPDLYSINDTIGHHVQASDDVIGHVEDFIIDDLTWTIRYLVINTRNWLPGKHVLVAPEWIDKVSWTKAKVFLSLPSESIEKAPEYDDEKPIAREYEVKLYQHYNCEGYWIDEPDNGKWDDND